MLKTSQKILFICGSMRKGNTEHVLSELYRSIDTDLKELILLKDKNIKFCKGCLTCYTKPNCTIKDDMEVILPKVLNSDICQSLEKLNRFLVKVKEGYLINLAVNF